MNDPKDRKAVKSERDLEEAMRASMAKARQIADRGKSKSSSDDSNATKKPKKKRKSLRKYIEEWWDEWDREVLNPPSPYKDVTDER
jgi:hypothetical protein